MFTQWPPRLSEFRLACVECHKRKIRCEPSLDGTKGLCEACQANNRPCLFSLRSKTGRPHKNEAGKQKAGGSRTRSVTLNLGDRGVDGAVAHHATSPPPYDQPATSPEALVPWKHTTSEELNFIFQAPEGCSSVPCDEKKHWLETPPSGTTFQEFGMDGMNDEVLFMEVLNGDSHISTSLQSHAFATEPSLAPGLGPSTPVSEPLDNVDVGILEDSISIQQSGEDFSDAMRLCSEIHRRCQSRPLNLLAEADQEELAFLLQTIDELGKKTLGRSQWSSSTSPNRQDQYKWMIIRVAVVQAIEIAAELIEFNLRATMSDSTTTTPTPQQNSVHRLDEIRSPIRNEMHSPEQSRIYLESVLSLCRLDYSLYYFHLFMSAQETSHEEYFSHSVSSGRDKHPSLILGRVERVRDEVWALAGQLRHLWK